MRIYIEHHPNIEHRTYHVAGVFFRGDGRSFSLSSFSNFAGVTDTEREKKIVGLKRAKALYKKMSTSEYIHEMTIHHNSISITRNQAFEWDDITEYVRECVDKYFSNSVVGVSTEVVDGGRQPWMDRNLRSSNDRDEDYNEDSDL